MLTALCGNVRASDYSYLVFTLTDGTTQSIVTTNLSLTFNNGNLTAKNETDTLIIPLANLQKMEFSNDEATVIEEYASFGQNQTLIFDNSADIYDLRGSRITKDQMRKGIYIIKQGNKTYKITVR